MVCHILAERFALPFYNTIDVKHICEIRNILVTKKSWCLFHLLRPYVIIFSIISGIDRKLLTSVCKKHAGVGFEITDC